MSLLVHHIPRVLSTESKGVDSHEFQRCSTPIDVLDDDSLLNIFWLYRPPLLDGDEDHSDRILWGLQWKRERWWYKLTHVCRRWRHLILASPSHLGLSLLCAPGTPVADMLAHSPPFPIVIDHFRTGRLTRTGMTANDVEGIILALGHRDRVRRIRFRTRAHVTEKILVPIDGEFSMLEYMCIAPTHDTCIRFPKTFQAPQLRHLILVNFIYPIGSPPLSTAMGLVGLALVNIVPCSVYFQPNELLHRLSLLPQLETLWIGLEPSHYPDLRETHMHNATHTSLPNLRFFQFRGFHVYSEALLSRITAPHLEVVQVTFWTHRIFSAPCLLQFMSTSEDLRLGNAILLLSTGGVRLSVYPNEMAKLSVFDMRVEGAMIFNAVQILNSLSPLFSSVVYLTLDRDDDLYSHSWPTPTDWRILLRSFNNVKILFVGDCVIQILARFLQLDDEESPNDLLPELKELTYFPTKHNADAFAGFLDARQNAGRPVTLVHLQNAASTPFRIRVQPSSLRIFQPVLSIDAGHGPPR